MTHKSDKSNLGTKAAIAGAAIGSAALAAALLYVSRRNKDASRPKRPTDAPETD
jgi:hypothetical protein